MPQALEGIQITTIDCIYIGDSTARKHLFSVLLALNRVEYRGRIVIVGLFKRGLSLTLPALDLTRKEMTILGSRASVNCFPEALQLLASGAIRYPSVATDFSLWDAPGVFARLADDPAAVHKAVLTL